jgi:hypothetical protein
MNNPGAGYPINVLVAFDGNFYQELLNPAFLKMSFYFNNLDKILRYLTKVLPFNLPL